jgi:hypothetical protein
VITGILISCAASALAVVAALLGERRYPASAAIVIAVNSVVLSPLLWFKHALDATSQPSYAVLTAVGLLPPVLAWLGYWLAFARRRAAPG